MTLDEIADEDKPQYCLDRNGEMKYLSERNNLPYCGFKQALKCPYQGTGMAMFTKDGKERPMEWPCFYNIKDDTHG